MRRSALVIFLTFAACSAQSKNEGALQSGLCVTGASPGDHIFTCDGLRVDVRAPRQCPQAGCGLILLLHGDTGSGLLEDAHVRLRDLGEQHGYVVVAPTGPLFAGADSGSTWNRQNDATLMRIVREVGERFRTDANRVHVTGFSRGGFVTWRLFCDHADVFASVAPAAAGVSRAEVTCFANGRAPSRKIPVLFLMGRNDRAVDYPSMAAMRDLAISRYSAKGPDVLATDAKYTHQRWTAADGVVIETFEHSYETNPRGPWGSERGHCLPGSTVDPFAPRYALPCVGPTAFTWGEEVVKFFDAHQR
jgi:poly(3-hydroxybutyrate) depolymerase